MSTTLNRLNPPSLANHFTRAEVKSDLSTDWGHADVGGSGIPTGNAAYWATLRSVQSPRVSRQGWKAVLDVLRKPSYR